MPLPTSPYSNDLDPPPSLSKKKHICQICARAFTTSGHLSRHTRIHTGERNHKCPFPGCETRCSRQDNLQQHYRIHLSPGSRRNSGSATRAAMNRASASDRPRPARRRSGAADAPDPHSPSPPPPLPSPPLEPPPLTPAYHSLPPPPPLSAHSSLPEPPDTPPPLAHAYPTLPPPSAPAYSQQSLPRAQSRSSTSTPEASYHSPVSYPHSSLPPPGPPYHPSGYDHYPYPSSQDSRPSYARTPDDPRWSYSSHQHPYSDSDRYSPADSPVANTQQYVPPPSPVDVYHSRHLPSVVEHQQQDSASYYDHYQPRQANNTALGPGPSPGTLPAPLAQSQSQPSSHRHSIAHISNPVRQHSPISTNSNSAHSAHSTHSASPVVSHPPTPGYPYVASTIDNYAESPPGSVSPAAPASQSPLPSGLVSATAYGSYESSSLASAGYTHPPVPMQPPTQHQPQAAYHRTLPSLSLAQPTSILHTAFNYGQAQPYHSAAASATGGANAARQPSPPPVLAPIRSDGGNMRYASPVPQAQPPMQQQQQHSSLASVSRSSGHAFSYPSHSHAHAHSHSPTYPPQAPSPYPSGSAAAGTGTGSACYYYQPQSHAAREPSPEPTVEAPAADHRAFLELHQPQPQRVAAAAAGGGTGHAHQYIQSGAVLGGQGHATVAAGGWRGEDYRGRLVQ